MKQRGYVTLIAAVLIGAVSFLLLLSFLSFSTGAIKEQGVYERGKFARVYAESCAEEALQRVADSQLYLGSDSMSFSYGSCTFTVNGDYFYKDIDVSSSAGNAVRRLRIYVDEEGIEWLEVQ